MHRSIRSLLPVLVLALTPFQVRAQVATGTPPFSSVTGGFDSIDLANLNVHLTIPIIHKAGRGTNFDYDLTYDSSVWTNYGTWYPTSNWGWAANSTVASGANGYQTSSWTETLCYDGNGHPTGAENWYGNSVYHDPWGTAHYFSGYIDVKSGGCGNSEVNTYPGTSDSGLTILGPGGNILTSSGATITAPDNPIHGAYTSLYEDRNGNWVNADGTGKFFDTLSSTTPVLTISGSTPLTFTYTTSTGTSAHYTMNFTNYTVATNFGVPGVGEYKSGAAVALVSSIVLPDSSQYSFTYEATPGSCTPYAGTTCVTARIAQITLPTGGIIKYAYSGGHGGILSDGSTATLTRTTPDGVWTYAQTKGTGAASATLITAPKLSYDSVANQTIAEFQGIYVTQTDTYQGAAPTFTTVPVAEATLQASNPLREVQTCYNASASPCTSTVVAGSISQRTVTASVLGPGKLWSQHTDKYNGYEMQTESDDYDFAATPPGTRLQQTLITYASLGGYLSAFPATVEVLDASGNIKSRQDTAYDAGTLTCITGAPQHDDTGYPCTGIARGNATSVTTYTNPSVPSGGITKNFTYDSTSNLLTAQVNCCELKTWAYSATTGYAYPDSVTSGSSSPQLKTTATYDLNMGLVLTSTDPNNLKTTLTYDNIGRPLTSTTGTNPATTSTYTDTGSSWTALVCAPVQGTSTACQKTIMDSQGRVATSQLLDGSSNLYSATDTQYDALGRA